MHIIDSHFHWYPRPVFEKLCKSTGYPRAEQNGKGYRYWRRDSRASPNSAPGRNGSDLEDQLAHMDGLGHQVDVNQFDRPLLDLFLGTVARSPDGTPPSSGTRK